MLDRDLMLDKELSYSETNDVKTKKSIIVSLLVILVYLENMQLVPILGTSLKPHHLVFIYAVLFVMLYKKYVSRVRTAIAIVALVLPMLPLYRISDQMEWVKSYVIWGIATIYFAWAFPWINEKFQENRTYYIKLFIYLALLIQTVSVIQFAIMNTTGNIFLRNLFGPLQYIKPYVSTKNGIYRAFSVFHEPSVLGWVNSSALAVVLYTGKENLFSKKILVFFHILCAATMICSLSAVGMIGYLAVWSVYALNNAKNKKSFFGIVIGIVVLIYLWNFTLILDPLRRITSEVDTVNTSGYERLNAPRQFALKTLRYYPFLGRGIGQSGDVDLVGTISTAISQEANNSLYQMIMNLGLSSIILVVIFVHSMLERIKYDRDYWLIAINVLVIFLSTGAYLSLDFAAVLNVLLLVYKGREVSDEEDFMGVQYSDSADSQ